MTTNTTIKIEPSPRAAAAVKINRLGSVEEELTDRMLREKNGKPMFAICREMAGLLSCAYSNSSTEVMELGNALIDHLVEKRDFSRQQAGCILDLALDLIHARIHGTYRRSNVDLGFLIAVASGEVTDVAAN